MSGSQSLSASPLLIQALACRDCLHSDTEIDSENVAGTRDDLEGPLLPSYTLVTPQMEYALPSRGPLLMHLGDRETDESRSEKREETTPGRPMLQRVHEPGARRTLPQVALVNTDADATGVLLSALLKRKGGGSQPISPSASVLEKCTWATTMRTLHLQNAIRITRREAVQLREVRAADPEPLRARLSECLKRYDSRLCRYRSVSSHHDASPRGELPLEFPERFIGKPTCTSASLSGQYGPNQDRALIISDMSCLLGLVGNNPVNGALGPAMLVADGHGGSECAQWVVDQFPLAVAAAVAPVDRVNPSSPSASQLVQALQDVDARFAVRAQALGLGDVGACLTAVWAPPGVLYVAHLGDTAAVLATAPSGFRKHCCRLDAVRLTELHNAREPGELERVQACGGEVILMQGAYRVNGRLQVTRAMGDTALRPFVSQDVQVITRTRTEADAFLIVASDGLWDVMTPQEAVDAVHAMREAVDSGGLLEEDSPRSQKTVRTFISRARSASSFSDVACPYDEIVAGLADYASDKGAAVDDVTIAVMFF